MNKITLDTNVLARVFIQDDEEQCRIARKAVIDADLVAISLTCLCEFSWVLLRSYRLSKRDLIDFITAILEIENISLNRPAVEFGLAVLKNGGDFSDGIIAYSGFELGGEVFFSFDKKANSVLESIGHKVTFPS